MNRGRITECRILAANLRWAAEDMPPDSAVIFRCGLPALPPAGCPESEWNDYLARVEAFVRAFSASVKARTNTARGLT